MKNIRTILALAVALVTFAAPAFADGFQIRTLPRLKWVKYAGSQGIMPSLSDSTVSATPFNPGAVAGLDTTQWLDLSQFNFPTSGITAQPIVALQVNAGLTAAGDSAEIQLQFTADEPSAGVFNTQAVVNLVGTTICPITSVFDAGTTYFNRWVRVIYRNTEQSAAAGRNVSIVPILKVAK